MIDIESNVGYKVIKLATGEQVVCRCVLIATGVKYRRLPIPNCQEFESCGVYYSATAVEVEQCRDRQIIIVGGGNSAGQAAIFLSQYVAKVFLLIRGDNLAKTMSQYLIDRIEQTENIQLLSHTEVTAMMGDSCLKEAEITNNQTKAKQTLEVAGVFIFIGAVPCTDWMPDNIITDVKGFIKTGTQLTGLVERDYQPFLLETSQSGIFAAGDVRLDSIKRVASAVGEGSMTVHFVHRVLAM